MSYGVAEGYNAPDDDSPGFAVADLVGFRAWRLRLVREDRVLVAERFRGLRPHVGQLASPACYFAWTEAAQLAQCCSNGHPRRTCRHGFYASHEAKRFAQIGHSSAGILIDGLMRGWGHCVIGSAGFRSQYGQIVALVVPTIRTFETLTAAWAKTQELDARDAQETIWRALESFYPNVPIYASVSAMLDDHPLSGRPR